ncbi:MAG: ABC transporter ATP-binding protein, partial [Nitrospinota bacterium]
MAELIVRKISKTFRTTSGEEIRALEDVSFDVKDGEFVCLLGPSGCGKSTLLRIAAGLEEPTSGAILLDGRPIVGPGPDRGMVFQEHLLFPWRTVTENVEYGLEVKGLPKKERNEVVLNNLKLVGMEKFTDAFPKELSGGMKQRVGIARALANDPAVLLMDEPFASVDAQTRTALQAELLTIWWGKQKTILFVTHSVEEAVFLADRIFLLTPHPGRVQREVRVGLPRPRYRVSAEFNEIRRDL